MQFAFDFFKNYPIYKQKDWSNDENSDNIPYFSFLLLFTTFVFLFELYIDQRQVYNFKTIKKLPKELVGVVTDETFEKSNLYGADKLIFQNITGVCTYIFNTILLFYGWLPYAWDLSITSTTYIISNYISSGLSPLSTEILTSLCFIFITSNVETLFALPFSLYSTFVIEQRHGFNKSTLALFFQDKIMGIALFIIIGFPIIGIMIWVIRLGGPYFYFYVWVFFFVVSIVMMILYPTLIAPLFNKYTKLEDGPVYTAIEELAKKVSFPLTQIYVVDGSRRSAHSNAYFYGFFKSKRIVLYDTLLTQVELPELLAIVGHEIGHWKLWHTIEGFVISQFFVFSLFLVFSYVQNTPGLFIDFGFKYSTETPMPVFIGLTLFLQVIWSPVEKFLTFFLNINSRRNEFAADAYSNQLGMGEALCSGLIKISVENLGNLIPDPLYSAYYFSHPPVVERIRAIQKNVKKEK